MTKNTKIFLGVGCGVVLLIGLVVVIGGFIAVRTYGPAFIESTTRAAYYPGAAPITVKLLAEAGAGRLIGGQVVGGKGSAKRIDVVAAAIWNGMTADELVNLDLSYAPPFSPVWDPVQTAARQLV